MTKLRSKVVIRRKSVRDIYKKFTVLIDTFGCFLVFRCWEREVVLPLKETGCLENAIAQFPYFLLINNQNIKTIT
ncbi:MAG: hypothetical protein VR66_03275 [Peptococcaceae bacterium BRH_c23]|nr:MAG: hypothetical protein VR66_03275 [Peptococcaceae bacterium BRH_c23]KJS88193.1 MAG: hypothetical protein JL57_12405 [Desulfosporosinus sp. BICA1-9]HBW36224.1 hypothetical protein [Desulfosporosinus sp.]